jgi:prevent-host-death family protein
MELDGAGLDSEKVPFGRAIEARSLPPRLSVCADFVLSLDSTIYGALYGALMESFNIRDLRERTGELVRNAEQGKLAVVAKHGHPLFVAVPLDETLLRCGLGVALAIKLFQDGTISLGKAAKLSGLPYEAFVEQLASLGIAAVDYAPDQLDGELAAIG